MVEVRLNTSFESHPLLARYTDFQRPVYLLLGLPFDAIDMATAVDQVATAARSGRRFLLSTPNLNWLITCQQDEAFRNSVLQSELSLPDGMPVVWLARLLGLPLRQRVPGSDLFQRLRARTLAVHFFGGPPGFAGQACENLNRSGDPMHCRGHLSPGFGSVEEMSDPATLDAINASGADFLVVALGARKGQAWILRNLDRLRIPVVSHLGAVVNFVAGTVARAPGLVGKLGLEWLWRIKEEPGLWRRYWQDGIGFLSYLLRHGLPALILSRQTPSRSANLEVIADSEGQLHLRLSGFWSKAGLGPLREALTDLNPRPRALRLDLAGVSHLDSAALGLLALLRGHQVTHHQPLVFVGASPALRRRLAHFGAGYLLEPLTPAERR
jgi:N-acetylglucosaminyldiphosphoundecaprenol N-acetyl-beta-D-mannosaminyltransferase